jgi:hypothetical protein
MANHLNLSDYISKVLEKVPKNVKNVDLDIGIYVEPQTNELIVVQSSSNRVKISVNRSEK